jgi:magnesium chelatase accessory protein
VLLLHGAGASTHSWRHLLPDLARDFRVVAPDLPGQGFTRLGSRSRCGLAEMSADITTLLTHQGLVPDAIIGHSAGAAIGLRLALDLRQPPKAVVCINAALEDFRGPARSVFPALAQLLAMTPLPAYAFSRAALFPSTIKRALDSTGSTIDAEGLDLYRRLLMDRHHVDATLCMMANWKLTGLMADLARLNVPALLIVGARDRAVPPEISLRASEQIEGSNAVSIDGYGHLIHEEAPELTSGVLRSFLSAAIARSPICCDNSQDAHLSVHLADRIEIND